MVISACWPLIILDVLEQFRSIPEREIFPAELPAALPGSGGRWGLAGGRPGDPKGFQMEVCVLACLRFATSITESSYFMWGKLTYGQIMKIYWTFFCIEHRAQNARLRISWFGLRCTLSRPASCPKPCFHPQRRHRTRDNGYPDVVLGEHSPDQSPV